MMLAERTVDKIKRNPDLPLYEDNTKHPPKRHKTRHPICDLEFPAEALSEIWKTLHWRDSGVRGVTLIETLELRVSDFDLPRIVWTKLNRIRTKEGKCKRLIYMWGMEQSTLCLMIRYIVEECPNTKFECRVEKLHGARTKTIN